MDPWDGRTLEWSTSSPAPLYNFAIIPIVKDRDDFLGKQKKENYKKKMENVNYDEIHMPRNTGLGFLISIFASLFGFFSGLAYYLVVCFFSFFAIIISLVINSLNENNEYTLLVEDIKKIENQHCKNIRKAGLK